MVNMNADAVGVIFPNSYDSLVPELVNNRSMASIPFASRYRMVDFVLSSMVNCGIDNVVMVTRKNYRSLMDHLGSGREWDLARKNGGLNVIPPYAQRNVQLYNGRVEALASIIGFLRDQKEKYVILADSHIAMNFDFEEMLENHIQKGADISAAYLERELPVTSNISDLSMENLFYTFDITDGRVTGIEINPKKPGVHHLGMNIYILDREMMIEEIHQAYMKGYTYFERDFLAPLLKTLNVQAFEYKGYAGFITGMKSYFTENMKMLEDENLDALFSYQKHTIYTKIRDDNPTRYVGDAKTVNMMAADGCVIEGQVENSVLFRGVKVGKGAVVKNCVLMQDTVIEDGAYVEYVVTDKNVVVTAGKEVHGTESFPVYITKKKTV